MLIGEQDVVRTKPRPFLPLRLLHLHDHRAAAEDLLGVRRDVSAGGAIVLVRCADAVTRARHHQHLVATADIPWTALGTRPTRYS